MTIKIRFGHSPDPDDAFMFYAIAKKKIPLDGFAIQHVVEDIESLNQRALKGELEVTAVSVHAYAYVSDCYAVMRCGASVGDQYGPIIVSKVPMKPQNLRGKTIAIPGLLTTANLVLKLFSQRLETQVMPFDKIMDAVAKGKVDAGLVIHEGQLTFQKKKLHKVLDLGEWWWKKTKLPLPLGIDVIRRDLGPEAMKRFSNVFQESIRFGLEHWEEALDYAMQFGRGMERDLGKQFVGMYVNQETLELSRKSEAAVEMLLKHAKKAGIISGAFDLCFV